MKQKIMKRTRRKSEKTKDIIDELYPKLSESEEKQRVMDGVMKIMEYDVENNPCLLNFDNVKSQSSCMFAKKAKLWGCPAWDQKQTLGMDVVISKICFVR